MIIINPTMKLTILLEIDLKSLLYLIYVEYMVSCATHVIYVHMYDLHVCICDICTRVCFTCRICDICACVCFRCGICDTCTCVF